MPLVVGIDESGYGPLLGPLVIGATLWRCAPAHVDACWWTALQAGVRRAGGARGDARLVVDDSKKAYDRKSIATLERTVLAFAEALRVPANTLAALLAAFSADLSRTDADACPWYADLTQPLPRDPTRSACSGAAARLGAALAAADCTCLGVRLELLPENDFNAQLARTRNKAAVELAAVLRLIAWAAAQSESQDLYVRVDRLGGRADYRDVLLSAFPERHLHILEVSPTLSQYRLAGPANDWIVEFRVDADQLHLPVALASMCAKYVRELLMERFNDYWRRRAPGVAPTAGYYQDAQRFLAAIAPAVAQAGPPLAGFVRQR